VQRLDGGDGFIVWPGFLDHVVQSALLDAVIAGLDAAPLYLPRMPRSGRPFSVRQTNFGPLGWISDERGYRYEPRHPVTDAAWPAIPDALLALWEALTGYPAPPDACLVNHYVPGAKMGLHRDADEDALDAPVLSVSLGDTARFSLGGPERKGPTRKVLLASGDVMMLSGPARHFYHGVDKLLGGTSGLLPRDLFPEGGRLNLTLRRVRPA